MNGLKPCETVCNCPFGRLCVVNEPKKKLKRGTAHLATKTRPEVNNVVHYCSYRQGSGKIEITDSNREIIKCYQEILDSKARKKK